MTDSKAAPKFAPIYTERLELRVFDPSLPSDYESVISIYDSPYARRTVGNPGVYTPDDVDGRCARFRLQPSPRASTLLPTHPFHLIYLRNTTTLVGLTSLFHRATLPSPDLGYAILEPHINKGYATEASSASLRWWTETMHIPDIWAAAFDTNLASQAVARKIGLVDGGELRILLGEGLGGEKRARVFVQRHMGLVLDGRVVDVTPNREVEAEVNGNVQVGVNGNGLEDGKRA